MQTSPKQLTSRMEKAAGRRARRVSGKRRSEPESEGRKRVSKRVSGKPGTEFVSTQASVEERTLRHNKLQYKSLNLIYEQYHKFISFVFFHMIISLYSIKSEVKISCPTDPNLFTFIQYFQPK